VFSQFRFDIDQNNPRNPSDPGLDLDELQGIALTYANHVLNATNLPARISKGHCDTSELREMWLANAANTLFLIGLGAGLARIIGV
jgi:hypothetical protein